MTLPTKFMTWKLTLKPIYAFFAPTDGFAEFIVVVSFICMIILAFLSKLTDSYAAALTAIGTLGVVHDNWAAWTAAKAARNTDQPKG
jgi:hypothetical protein